MEKKVANVDRCKILCLDEADKLLSQDFKGMLDRLLSHLPSTRQVLLYSATFPLTVEHFMVMSFQINQCYASCCVLLKDSKELFSLKVCRYQESLINCITKFFSAHDIENERIMIIL